MTQLGRPRTYTRSTPLQRDEAVRLVQEVMRESNWTRTRAATLVGRSMGFSRSAVIGWCDEAGISASHESENERRLRSELDTIVLINQRLSARLGEQGH